MRESMAEPRASGIKLFDYPLAPNPRKLRVYLAEKGLTPRRISVNLVWGEQRSAAFLAKNPLGTLPVVELEDGSVLSESLAIMEYLEELYPEPPMIGTTAWERARTRRLERVVDLGVLQPVAGIVHNRPNPLWGRRGDPRLIGYFESQLAKNLEVVDREIGARRFVAGQRPTIADCTLLAAMVFAIQGEVAISERFQNVHRWYDLFRKRPSAAG
jgi:glutathione S-transferase